MIATCPSKINCPGTDFPFLNNSSEGPDVLTFFDVAFGYNPPPLSYNFTALGCVSLCESTVSQADANQCAANQAYLCANGQQQNPGLPGTPIGPGQVPPVYSNGPKSCTTFCKDGLPFTFTVPGGYVVGPSQAVVDFVAQQNACSLSSGRRICLGKFPTDPICGGQFFSASITATGSFLGQYPFFNTFSIISGNLPQGIVFNGGQITGDSVSISGTPTEGGQFTFTVQVEDPLGDFQRKTYVMRVINIDTQSFPSGSLNAHYSQTLQQTGAKTPVSWQVQSGQLPPGLALNEETGEISGTPTQNGDFTFTIALQESAT